MTIDPALLGVVAFALGGLFVEWLHSRMQRREAACAATMAQQQATIGAQAARMQQMQACIDEMDSYIGERSAGEASAQELWGDE